MTEFIVLGDPVPQPRPRVSSRGGFARAYVPAKHPVHAYRKQLEAAAREAGVTPSSDPIAVTVVAFFARPKSHMTKRGVKATAPRLPRPDVDNIAKAVLDALQPVIGDDTNVSTLIAMKAYNEHAGTHVVIEPVEAA